MSIGKERVQVYNGVIERITKDKVNDFNLPTFKALDVNDQMSLLELLFTGQVEYVKSRIEAGDKKVPFQPIGTFVFNEVRAERSKIKNELAAEKGMSGELLKDEVSSIMYDKVSKGELRTKRYRNRGSGLKPIILSSVDISKIKR